MTEPVSNEPIKSDSTKRDEPSSSSKDRFKASSGRTILALILVTAVTKVFGFAREVFFGRWYGVGEVAEAFKVAQTIPMALLLIVGTGISTGFIPIYTELGRKKGTKAADEFMSNLMNVLILFSLAFSFLVTFFPEIFVRLFASGYAGSKFDLTVFFTQIAVWGTLFNMATYIMAPYLQLNNQYLAPALMVIPGNLVFILLFYLGRTLDPTLVAFSVVLAIMTQLLWLIPFVRRYGYRHRLILKLNDQNLKRFFIIAAPVVVGVAVNQVNIMIDKNIASFVMDGGVAILDYANRMTTFVQAIFIYPVAAVFFPNMTRYIIDRNFDQAKTSTTSSLIILALIVLPCQAGLVIFARPIIDLLFASDTFTQNAVDRTAQAMFWYAAGLFFWAWRDILIRVYYAFSNTRTPTINAMIGVAVNIVFNLVLSRFIGLNGLAMATSISGGVSCYLMMRSLRTQQNFKLDYRLLLNRMVKIILATLAMSAAALAAYTFMKGYLSDTLSLFLSILLAVVSYAAGILLVRLPEVRELISALRTGGRK